MMLNKKRIHLVVYVVLFAVFGVLSLPFFQDLIIDFTEKCLGRTLRDTFRWKEIIRHCSYIVIFGVVNALVLSFTSMGASVCKDIRADASQLAGFLKTRKNSVLFLFLVLFYTAVYYKVIASDFLYCDDIWRSYEGSRSWIGFSRYVSEFLSIVFHTSVSLSDIAPLSQFISILIMSIATIILAYIVNDKKISLAVLLPLSLIFISPFYAENFSYRFDSPYMALAVLFPIIPFVMKDSKPRVFMYVSVIAIILGCMCYQAGSSIYIVLTLFIVLKQWQSKTPAAEYLSFILRAAASYIVAMIVFRVFFMNTLTEMPDSYVSTAVSFSSISGNMLNYMKTTLSLFGGIWIKLFAGFSFCVSAIIFVKHSEWNKIISCAVYLLCMVLCFVFSFGPYLLFARTLLVPRVFLGFNVLLAIIAFNACAGHTLRKACVPMALVYGCIVFLFVYGNCLSKQKEYQQFRTELLLSDLADCSIKNEKIYFTVKGTVGASKGYKESSKNFPLIGKLVTVIPTENSIWNDDCFNTYNIDCKEEFLAENPGHPLLVSNYYHDIYGKDNHFFIVLK